MLPFRITPSDFNAKILDAAFAILPAAMDTTRARVMVIAICLQESGLAHRRQVGGPARGFPQMEKGGGVRGVLQHHASRRIAADVCKQRGVDPEPDDVYNALDKDDVLAACFARLLLWTSPKALPDDEDACWDYYIDCWRPGKPHRNRWTANYKAARDTIYGN